MFVSLCPSQGVRVSFLTVTKCKNGASHVCSTLWGSVNFHLLCVPGSSQHPCEVDKGGGVLTPFKR